MPPVPPDAGTIEDCQDACDNLQRLQCPGWQGSPGPDEIFGTADDMSCVAVCEDIVADPAMTLFQLCTAAANSCDEVEACFDPERDRE